jgi:UrcA family protein
MKEVIIRAAGALAAVAAAGIVVAQGSPDVPMPEVTVESSRMATTTIDRSSSGVPIVKVSYSYTVSAQGLDIASHIGALAFEARVKDAALAACKQIGKQYPDSTPADAQCAQEATAKAMVQVRQLEDAALKISLAKK